MLTIWVTRPVRSVADLGAAINVAVYGPEAAAERPVARNLDALADVLREISPRYSKVVVADWGLTGTSASKMLNVFEDAGVQLVR